MDGETKQKYKDVIFRYVRKGGQKVLTPIHTGYRTAVAVPRKAKGVMVGAAHRAADTVAHQDPGEWGGWLAEGVARFIEGGLKNQLDFQVEKAEDSLARAVHAYEVSAKRKWTRRFATAQAMSTGRLPDKISAEDPIREMFDSVKGSKKSVMKLRQAYNLNKYGDELKKIKRRWEKYGMDVNNPMVSQMIMQELMVGVNRDLMTQAPRDRQAAEELTRIKREKERRQNR